MYLSGIGFRCSLFPVCNWRQTVRIYCRDTFRVVISKRVSPDDCLDFLHSQFLLYQADKSFPSSASQTSSPSVHYPSISRYRSYFDQRATVRVSFCIHYSYTDFKHRCGLLPRLLCQSFCTPPLSFLCTVLFSCSYPSQEK